MHLSPHQCHKLHGRRSCGPSGLRSTHFVRRDAIVLKLFAMGVRCTREVEKPCVGNTFGWGETFFPLPASADPVLEELKINGLSPNEAIRHATT